jgi:hypothetical protein
VAGGAEVGEGEVERLLRDAQRLALREHGEARVEPGGERVRSEHATAEAVDRRDPGRLGVARQAPQLEPPLDVGARPAQQLGADAALELARGAVGEREGDDVVDPGVRVRARVRADDVAVALHEHGRLAGSGAGGEEEVAIAVGDGG